MKEEITRVVFRKWYTGRILAAVAAVVALLLLPGVSHALTNEQDPLVGLRGVSVLVERMNPQVERLGLTKAQIQMDVELRLRKAGVRVLTLEERRKVPGMPYLYVNVITAFNPDSPHFIFGITVELGEMVTLERGFQAHGVIWSTVEVGSVGTSNIMQIRDGVGDMVDKFINDYLVANPKK